MCIANDQFDQYLHKMKQILCRKYKLRYFKVLASKASPRVRRLVAHLRVPRVYP